MVTIETPAVAGRFGNASSARFVKAEDNVTSLGGPGGARRSSKPAPPPKAVVVFARCILEKFVLGLEESVKLRPRYLHGHIYASMYLPRHEVLAAPRIPKSLSFHLGANRIWVQLRVALGP